ncbi:MAG: TraB/GumN family protein [Saprospiraceae bacterium]
MRKLFFWLFPAFLAAGCGGAQKAVYTPDQLVPTDNALLWKISGNGLSKPSYLYGTIHLIPKADLAFSEPLLAALDRSKRVAFEIDMREMTNLAKQFSLITKSFMRDGKTLRDLLNTEDYALVQSKMAEKGLSMGMLERLKPMFLSMILSNEEENLQNSRMTSVEMELYQLARKRKLASAGLETAAYQISVFDSIPYDAQARMLMETLRSGEGEAGGGAYEDMLRLYRAEDISKMQSMVVAEGQDMARFEELLLTRRNQNWIPVMQRLMKETPTLFAVGAGHLGGPRGVIALLRAEGYRVEPEK